MTTATYNFASLILNVAFVGLLTAATAGSVSRYASLVALLVITQFSDQLKIRFISQLINRISSVLQKLLFLMVQQFQLLFPYRCLLILL